VPLPVTRPRSRPRSLTASASSLNGINETEYQRRLGLPWQRRALSYIDLVPEVNYASRFYSRMLTKIRLYPGLLDDNENVTRVTDGLPVELLSRIQDPGGGRGQLLASYGRLMFATGEGLVFGRYLNTERERWQFIWNDELQVIVGANNMVSEYQWRPSPREQWVTFYPEGDGREPTATAYRIWTPHPAMSAEADSPMRACLDIAEELIVLTSSVLSTAVSRRTNGIIVLPSELNPNPVEPDGDEDPLNNIFLRDLTEHITAAIENPGSAEAAAPFLIEGAYDYLDRFKWMPLHDSQTDYMERELRKEAIDRLAFGLDMPPETLKGVGGTNHWASLQVFNDMWASHGYSVAQQFANGLNQEYLRPAARDAGFAEWNRLTIIVDAAEVTTPPDRSQDADQAFDRGAITREGYRKLKNIPEDFAATEQDIEEWRAIKLRDPVLLGTGDTSETDPQQGPPPPGPEGDSGRRTRVVRASAAPEMLGAAALAVARCRELAGIRVKQKEKHCPEVVQQANGAATSQLAARIGEEGLCRLQLDALTAVRGGADTFRSLLPQWGVSSDRADMLADMVEVFASRTLFEESQPALPDHLAAHFHQEAS